MSEEIVSGLFVSKYGNGEQVYLITDPDQRVRIVTSVSFNVGGAVVYSLSQGTTDSDHFEAEISKEKDVLKSIT